MSRASMLLSLSLLPVVTAWGAGCRAAAPPPAAAVHELPISAPGRVCDHHAALARAPEVEVAHEMVDRIYKGAAVYFVVPHTGPDGAALPCRFPPDVGPTPPGSPCDHPGDQFPDDPDVWDQPSWAALSFMMEGAHRYRYEFTSNGRTGGEARFVVSAYGDLDCDGVWSTFRRLGFGVDDDGGGSCGLSAAKWFEADVNE
jgi:hypothetical protein